MARVIREEFQDKNGNIHYLHTEDCIVWCGDGRALRDTMENVQFEDYEAEGAEVPDAETALINIRKGKSWTNLFSNIKAFCKGVVLISRVLDSENITENGYLMSGRKCSELFQEVNVNIDNLNKSLSSIINNVATALSGSETYSDLPAGTTTVTIKFAKTFATLPTVLVSGVGTGCRYPGNSWIQNPDYLKNLSAVLVAGSVTKGGFQVKLTNNIGGGYLGRIAVTWNATAPLVSS